jgi:hypothetical protein
MFAFTKPRDEQWKPMEPHHPTDVRGFCIRTTHQATTVSFHLPTSLRRGRLRRRTRRGRDAPPIDELSYQLL